MKPSGVEWIGDIPVDWKTNRVKDVTSIIKTGKTPPSKDGDYFDGGIINWFTPGDMSLSISIKNSKRKVVQDAIDENLIPMFEANTVLLVGIGATVGKVAQIERMGSCNQQINAICFNERMHHRFGLYYMLHIGGEIPKFASFVTLPIFTQTETKQLKVALPKYNKQQSIANFLDKSTSQIENAIKTKQAQLKTLEKLKKSIIYKAVTKGLDDSVPMKDSGIEWIGEIPEHWEAKMIKRFAKIKRGASPRPIADQKYFDDNGEFAWVRIADVSASNRYLENTTQRLSELGAQYSVKQYPGDLFISIAGTVGKPIISKIKCCIHDGFVWFDDITFNKEYLYFIFYAGLPYGGLGKLGTQLNLNTDTIGKIYIPSMPKKEVDEIVKYLNKELEKINPLKSNVKKQINKLKEYKKSLIYEYVTGKKQVKE